MALTDYSTTNLWNSVAAAVAARWLEAGYVLWWQGADLLQLSTTVSYPRFFELQSTILELQDVRAALTASKGLLTISSPDLTFPRFPTRPTTDGSIETRDGVPVPMVFITLDHGSPGLLQEIGGRRRERDIQVRLIGYARDMAEQLYLIDVCRQTLDPAEVLAVRDHGGGTGAIVGALEVTELQLTMGQESLSPEHRVFEYMVTVRLRYEA